MATNHFCFTLNNYTGEEIALLQGPVPTGVTYVGYAYEVAESGTPHLQGYYQAKGRLITRHKEKWGGRMHIQAAKADSETALAYCKGPWENKEGTKSKPANGSFWEQGEYKHFSSVKAGQRSDIDQVKADIQAGCTYNEVREKHFATVAKLDTFIRKYIQDVAQGRVLDEFRQELSTASLRPWQQELSQRMDLPPGDRTVEWIWETIGNVGKSWMAKYLAVTKNALILGPGKFSDLAFIYTTEPKPIVVFDLSRVVAPVFQLSNRPLDVLYDLCEQLKNGHLVNTKYWSSSNFFRPPHVVFFANFAPNLSRISADRWKVTQLDDAPEMDLA
jgi:Putative viral replication protein